ncbi:MAG: hypothetical protein QXY55_02135 [Candidatus Korarchaeota archaeon]|nr:hypothetical protein [Thermoproteota archaeon]MCR8501115.1 hypothetical protein [Thermoproteota archaeon]
MIVNKFRTGLGFIDSLGGIPINQVVTICGPPGAGKTLLMLLLALRFLEDLFNANVVLIDPENITRKFDLQQICEKNMISEHVLSNIRISSLADSDLILNYIRTLIAESDENRSIFLAIDPFPSIFIGTILSRKFSDAKRGALKREVYSFLAGLRNLLDKRDYILMLVDEMRSITKEVNAPEFWKKEGSIPAFWNVLQLFTDTLILLKKVRRGLFMLRIVYSKYLPETIGFFKVGLDILI